MSTRGKEIAGLSKTASVPGPGATAVILARAGSKGLPGKNAMSLRGRPMVKYSIDGARGAKYVRRIIVSSDDARVLEAARTVAGVDLVNRPAELAGDTATVDAAARHAVMNDEAPIVVILYANVPVRPEGLIDVAIERLTQSGADSVQSYAPVGKYHPYWEAEIDDEARVSQYVENRIYRRQDLPPLYIPDGGVIAVTRESLFNVIEGEPHAFLGRDRRAVINDIGDVVDIDSRIDLLVAEAILSERSRPAAPSRKYA